MKTIRKMWAWIKAHAEDLKTFDPAMLRAVWVAVVGLAASLGILVSPAMSNKVDAFIGVLIAIIAILQGWSTKKATVPLLVSENAVTKALYTEPPPTGLEPAEYPYEMGDVQDDGEPA